MDFEHPRWTLPIALFVCGLFVGCGGGSSDSVPSVDDTADLEINPIYDVVDTGQVNCYDTDGLVIPDPDPGRPSTARTPSSRERTSPSWTTATARSPISTRG